MRCWWLLALAACGGDDPVQPTDPGTVTGAGTIESAVPLDCATQVPELPLDIAYSLPGFTSAEDFAFDLEGRYVATDAFGNIVRLRQDGTGGVWVPGFGESAGTHFLPDQHLAIASVYGGRVEKIARNGSRETIIGGLSYPNGVTADRDGRVYVADQNLGQLLRYDTATGELEVLASGLYNPNGLALSPDHGTIYIGSFGGGTVHRLDVTTPGAEVELLGVTPGAPLFDGGCAGHAEGDECFLEYVGIGTCVTDATGMVCAESRDTAACAGLVPGDPCATSALGAPVDSVCVTDPLGGPNFCPKVPGEVVTACEGLADGDPCTALGIDRECRPSWEGILVCDITRWTEASDAACDGGTKGDDCVIVDYEGYADGTCANDFGGLTCDPGWGYGYEFHGGLDGVVVDACGYVWVTEYTLGYVWRFPPEGGEPELAVETGAFWIPNLHFGHGIGGWEPTTLYVQDRLTDDLLAVEVGIPGAPVALDPATAAVE